MLGGNVGDEQRGADEEPTDVAPRKEIVFGGSFAPGKIHADAKHQREIESDNNDIRCSQSPVTRLNQRRVEHPLLLSVPAEQPRPPSGEKL